MEANSVLEHLVKDIIDGLDTAEACLGSEIEDQRKLLKTIKSICEVRIAELPEPPDYEPKVGARVRGLSSKRHGTVVKVMLRGDYCFVQWDERHSKKGHQWNAPKPLEPPQPSRMMCIGLEPLPPEEEVV